MKGCPKTRFDREYTKGGFRSVGIQNSEGVSLPSLLGLATSFGAFHGGMNPAPL
jgi:hypothetical protein